ncbi:MAG: TolC family protein [Phocaeicola sp.]|uniref:TolC family protein n=1 Tax=Phocaeicola sp. TaxID=2773926 RepID=UPI003FA00D97
MKRKKIEKGLFLLMMTATVSLHAQDVWDVDRCMDYAVKNNHTVRQRAFEVKNNKLDKLQAIGNFLPGLQGGIQAQYNYGRNIDPETNTYKNVKTFNNYYSLQSTLPIFYGGSLVNQVRQARVNVLRGKAALQEERDNVALETFQAYIQALYCQGTVRMAKKKLSESDSILYKTQVQEQVGLKGQADVAQMEAQQATDAYNLTKQQNLLATALLNLRQKMNYPTDEPLLLDSTLLDSSVFNHIELQTADKEEVVRLAMQNNPTLRKSEMNAKSTKIGRYIAYGEALPSVYMFSGLSTSYFKELHSSNYPSFHEQFNNNYGYYFGFTLSIPILNHFKSYGNVKKARNNYLIAKEQYEEQKLELRKLVEQAVLDREGYLKESIRMEKKEESDAIAYQVTKRKYEEGLMTSLDVQNNAATWLESQANLLQSKLTYFLKCRLVDYYKGEDIIKRK